MRIGICGFVCAIVLGVLVPNAAHAQVTGGGWIPGVNGGKATFGFDVSPAGTGNITYHDSSYTSSAFPNGVNIHGTVLAAGFIAPGTVEIEGTYTAEQGGTSGSFVGFLHDTGQGGAFKGDTLRIELYDPSSHLLYDHGGTLGNGGPGGGNITVAGASTVSVVVFFLLVLGWAALRVRPWQKGCRA
jgi:hypothetical protein